MVGYTASALLQPSSFTICRYPSTGPQNGWKVIKANGPSKLATFMLTPKIGHACNKFTLYVILYQVTTDWDTRCEVILHLSNKETKV